jgi:hypothetical protein
MASTTQLTKDYNAATAAYMQHDYRRAAALTKQLIAECPDQPLYHLLYGHIHLALENYQESIAEYQSVLSLAKEKEILDCANSGITTARERLKAEAVNYTQISEFELESGDDFDFTQPDPLMQSRKTFMQAPLKSPEIDMASATDFDLMRRALATTPKVIRKPINAKILGGGTPWMAMWCSWMIWMILMQCRGQLLLSVPLMMLRKWLLIPHPLVAASLLL